MSRFPVGDTLIGELPWQHQTAARGVFLPRDVLDEQTETAMSLPSGGRKYKRFGRLEEAREPYDAKQLEDLGLRVIRAEDGSAPAHWASDIPGEFEYHRQVGATTAYFADESCLRRAMERLADGYVFVRDFDVSMPSPVRSNYNEPPHSEPPDDIHDLGWRDAVGITQAHSDGVKGEGVLIGMLDTGVDADHTEFDGRGRHIPHCYVPIDSNKPIRTVRGFDTDGHGTHVAGLLRGNKFGIAPASQLLVSNVIESETVRTSFLRVVKGIDWLLQAFGQPDVADRPAIVNMSLGFPPAVPPGMGRDDYDVLEKGLRYAVGELIKSDVLVVAAIGNDGYGNFRLPAMYPEVLAVGAADYQDNVASFSGCSPNPADRKRICLVMASAFAPATSAI